ncbi:MAG: hypothetical protein J5J06_05430 [Phycisphaerae bacterium]|nr:hypothetical protein [Phycisphaerae bacterium]
MPRFDHLLASCLKHHAEVVRYANGVRTSLQRHRRAAYRFARDLIEIQQHHYNDFVRWVLTEGVDLDGWMDKYFDPIEQLGGDRRSLLSAVQNGMSEKEYVKLGVFAVAGSRKKAPSIARVDIDAEQPSTVPDETPEQRAERFQTLYEAARTEIRQIRKDFNELKTEVEIWRKTAEKVQRKKVG